MKKAAIISIILSVVFTFAGLVFAQERTQISETMSGTSCSTPSKDVSNDNPLYKFN